MTHPADLSAADFSLCDPTADATPVTPVSPDGLHDWLDSQPDRARAWVASTAFKAKPGSTCLLPGDDGGLAGVLLGAPGQATLWDWGGLPGALPPGTYALSPDVADPEAAVLGWALGGYRFDRYKSSDKAEGRARLAWPDGCDRAAVLRTAQATWLARNLINTPTADMGPGHLADVVRDLADHYGAACRVIVGDALLAENYPAVHAVGRAAADDRAPRLIDLTWGDASHPKVTLVGKGVCFDTGGLDIKPASAMKLMKKDMGGAANLIGAALMIMDAKLPVRLRLLVPAVENSIAGDAMRPLDVVATRAGKTVEIGHTDAEGRVILADALAEAASEQPELLIDFATLTGAARVALGTEVPALFCDDDRFADALAHKGAVEVDPLWRLPLWAGYRRQVDGKVADLTNAPEGGFGGAITAALFLREFVDGAKVWAHVDLMAWNTASKPGRPEGGEAMGMRALVAAIAERFG